LIETQELATSHDPGTMFWFYKKSEREANPDSKNQEYFHLTIHLGGRDFEQERYDRGKVHLVKKTHHHASASAADVAAAAVMDAKQSLNMRPYVFTKVEGIHKNNSGPDKCIQVIPIYNPDINQDTKLKLQIVKELNEYIWQLQIKDSRKQQWELQATQMKFLMESYIKAKLQKGSIMLRRTELKGNFIPQMLIQIGELNKFFTGRKRQFFKKCLTSSHSQEEVNKLIDKCRALFGNVETQLNTENGLKVVDPDEDDLAKFIALLEPDDKFLALEEKALNIDDVDVPDIGKIIGALEEINRELTRAIEAEAPVEDDEEPIEAEDEEPSRAAAEAGPSRAAEEKPVKTAKTPQEKAEAAVTKAKEELKAATASKTDSATIIALKAVVTLKEAKLEELRKNIREQDAKVRRDLQGTNEPTTKQGKARARAARGKNKITRKGLNKITRKRLNKTNKRKYK
jgi:hypothetical protein